MSIENADPKKAQAPASLILGDTGGGTVPRPTYLSSCPSLPPLPEDSSAADGGGGVRACGCSFRGHRDPNRSNPSTVSSESQIFNWSDVHALLVKKSIKVPMCLLEPSMYALIDGDRDDRLCSSYDSVLDAAAIAGVADIVYEQSSPRRTLQSQLSRCEDEEAEKARSLAADSMSPVHDGLVISKPPGMRFPLRRNMPASVEPAGHLHNANGFDAVSLSGSDGSSGRFTPKTSANMHSTFLQDATNVLSPFANNATSRNPLSSGDWSGSSAPDASTDGSTSNSGETGLRGAEDDVEKLRSEIGTLTRKLDVSDMELQTLRKQIVKESRRGQDLSKEMSSLRDERDALRGECEGLRGMKKTIHDANGSGKRLSDGEDPWSQVEELKQELGHEKNLNADLRVQLQKMQESNSELLLAVKDLDEMLEQKNRDMSILQEETVEDPQEAEYEHALSNVHSAGHKMDMSETSSYQEKEDELMLDALVKKSDGIASSELQEKILELSDEIELYKKDREDLEMQMEQLALDYEILKQENHDISSRLEQTQLREQLRMQYEFVPSLDPISPVRRATSPLDLFLAASPRPPLPRKHHQPPLPLKSKSPAHPASAPPFSMDAAGRAQSSTPELLRPEALASTSCASSSLLPEPKSSASPCQRDPMHHRRTSPSFCTSSPARFTLFLPCR
ncbi:uncharacterized protein LOC119283596 [Triticum dicoccoides]|uniref:uncharacterized protein LOC119283596 n=1 Tax=Triticum dicoccoides TaxID=85692 RepID=UPI00188FF4FC|nr:uncharacterized protein LOC119283596 [Triticum dicoccoides]